MSAPRPIAALLTVFRKEFRENLRERRTLFSALVFGPLFVPALLAVMLGLAIRHGAAESDARLAVAVAHGERAPSLVSRLVQYGVTVVPVSLDAAGARAAVAHGRFKQVLFVPKAYATQMAASSPAPLELYIDSSDGANRQAVARLSAIIEQYNSTLVHLRLLVRGIDPLTLSAIALQSVDVATPADRSVLMLGTLSYFIIIAMLMGGQYLAIDATAGERERGSLEPLLTVPVRREQLLYGKILAACAFMLISLALTVVALSVALRFVGLARLGMSLNLGPLTVILVIGCCVPLAPLGAAL
ncbi:MAG: ABC transporter permease, partial [Steroidobacteraceae bacterium]